MIREYYEAICNGVDVRANLIALRNALKDEKEIRAFAYLLGGDFSVLGSLLVHEDPKVRKNAAILLGKMESEDLLPLLFETYQKEETRFIRSDYLKAMEHMDYTPYLDELQERLQELRSVQAAPEEQKHVSEEIRMLQTMMLKYQKPEAHRFTAMDQAEDVILVTNKEQSAVTAHKFPAGCCRRLKGGVRVNGVPMREILPIRTYTELLFPIDAETLPQSDPEMTGRRLGGDSEQANSLTKRMQRMHSGTGPYRFRIELKSRMEASKKGVYIRKLSDALERASKGMWINSATDYEAEVRLLERKDGGFTPFLKLYTIKDKRFSYRKEFVSSSIAPVNAALTAELATKYLKENGQILDPFCGVGTMLIERNKAVKAKEMYGLDIFGEAIEKARINAQQAGCRIQFINRDFFTFEHAYLFDEIISDLPQVTQAKPKQEIHELYLEFFRKAPQHLKENAVLILYVTEPQFVAEAVRRHPEYRVEEMFLLNEKNRTTVYVLRYLKN